MLWLNDFQVTNWRPFSCECLLFKTLQAFSHSSVGMSNCFKYIYNTMVIPFSNEFIRIRHAILPLKICFLTKSRNYQVLCSNVLPPILHGGSLGDLWDNLGCLIRFLSMKEDNFWHPEEFRTSKQCRSNFRMGFKISKEKLTQPFFLGVLIRMFKKGLCIPCW